MGARRSAHLAKRTARRRGCAAQTIAFALAFASNAVRRSLGYADELHGGARRLFGDIAKRYGFAKWQAIYDHPDNAEFKKKRPNPNLIFPGDRLAIPDKEQKEIDCAAGQVHRFKVVAPKTLLRMVLKADEDKPLGGKKDKLEVGDQALEGRSAWGTCGG